MPKIGTPSLDQLQLFLAVVDHGGFAAAGRALGRSTSVISYGIAGLEAQLGLLLFDRAGTRRPRLTAAGEAVLSEARRIADDLAGLKARVGGLLAGLEANVSLAVDVMLPAARLAETLRAFTEAHPTVSLRLHVEALGAVTALVQDGTAGLGVSGPLSAEADGLTRRAAGAVRLVPVAAPGHPLAAGPQPPGAVRQHVQLVLSDRSPLTRGRDFSVASPRSWRLADLGAKHALLLEGVGWGNMSEPLVADDLAQGRLVALDLPDHRGGIYTFEVVHRTDTPPGPAAAWLMARLAAHDDVSKNRTIQAKLSRFL